MGFTLETAQSEAESHGDKAKRGGVLIPYARNALDGRRVYFEDDGGDGAPVVLHGGIIDSVDLVRESNIAQALRELPQDEFRLIYVAHRGVGRSGDPERALRGHARGGTPALPGGPGGVQRPRRGLLARGRGAGLMLTRAMSRRHWQVGESKEDGKPCR
jgi:pimeloyl-ACP methyl ester carboxylesterase